MESIHTTKLYPMIVNSSEWFSSADIHQHHWCTAGPTPSVSNNFPGGTGAAGPGTTLGKPVLRRKVPGVVISSTFSKETKNLDLYMKSLNF